MRWALLAMLLVGCEGPPGPAGPAGPAQDAYLPPDAAPIDATIAVDQQHLDAALDAEIPPDAAPDATPSGCPPHVGPAGMGGVAHAALTLEEVERWRTFRADREQERMLEAWRPAVVRARYRIDDAACLSLDQLVDLGRGIFMRSFTAAEGFGDGTPGLRRFQTGHAGGPDAGRCIDCHWKGGFAGAGDRADNAFMFGDGDDLASHDRRNPPALWGVGWADVIAREMTAALQATLAQARAEARDAGRAITRPLLAKGVSFGAITAHADGGVDTSLLEGVDADLVVKPFGWKGTSATLEDFVKASLHLHHGLQSDALLADPGEVELGDGPPDDPDGDGVRREITAGQLDALVAFLATLDVPRMAPITDGGAFGPPLTGEIEIVDAPEFTARWLEGAVIFDEIGCSGCHVPLMPVDDPRLAVGARTIDLLTEAAQPHPVPNVDGRVLVPVFSDFKRHDMGVGLAGRHTEAGVGPRVYLTRRLWGVANTSPYLHDGRATTYDEAIGQHGGEAAGAAAAFAALPDAQKASVRIFLIGLKRGPAVRVR